VNNTNSQPSFAFKAYLSAAKGLTFDNWTYSCGIGTCLCSESALFLLGLIGTVASAVWRKTVSCTFLELLRELALCYCWFGYETRVWYKNFAYLFAVAIWIPIHIWSVMVANRDDYLSAGLHYFPLNCRWKYCKILFTVFVSLRGVYFALCVSDFKLLYLVVANALGILMIIANTRCFFHNIDDCMAGV